MLPLAKKINPKTFQKDFLHILLRNNIVNDVNANIYFRNKNKLKGYSVPKNEDQRNLNFRYSQRRRLS